MKQKKQKVMVYILNKKGKPLMPTTRCGHVRKLLDSKKAVVVNSNPFTIRLKYDTPNGVQDVFAGIDSGRENIGSGASNENGDCLYLGELRTSNKSIKIKMTERAGFRRERRRHDRQNKQRKARKDHTEIQNQYRFLILQQKNLQHIKSFVVKKANLLIVIAMKAGLHLLSDSLFKCI